MTQVPLLAFVASVALLPVGGLSAGPLIPVTTRSTALVFSTDASNRLTQYYVGLASGAPATYDPANDRHNVVYPAAGGVFHAQPALRASIFPYRPVPVVTRLRILGGTNPRSIPRRFPPNRKLVTSPMVFTYDEQGIEAAVARLRAWAQAQGRRHDAGVKSLLELPAAG